MMTGMTTLNRRGWVSWRKTLIAAGIGLCVMLIGILIGAGLTVLHFREKFVPESDGAARIGGMVNRTLTNSVELSDEEKAYIDEIVTAGVGDVEELNRQYGAMIQGRFDAMCGKICAVLGHERSGGWQEYVRRDFGEKAAQMIQHCRSRVAESE